MRVGGQSKSEKLEKFKLASVKQAIKRGRRINSGVMYQIKNERSTLIIIHLKSELELKTQMVQGISNHLGLLRFNNLEKFMNAKHVEQFKYTYKLEPTFNLLEWLGVYDESAKVPVKNKSSTQIKSKVKTSKGKDSLNKIVF